LDCPFIQPYVTP